MADEGDGGSETATQSVIEMSAFSNYLRRVVPVLLEDVDDTPAALNTALKERSSVDCMKKFLSDPQATVLIVQRHSSKGEYTFFIHQ